MKFFLLLIVSCAARAPAVKVVADLPALSATDDSHEPLLGPSFTVVEFFSAHCPCQRAHDARLREWYAVYHPRGVRFVVVDVEADSSLARDKQEAAAREYPFPILRDDSGAFADFFAADYATYAVVLDAHGQVVYRGGLDSDKIYTEPNAHLWLRDALDRLLAGSVPDPSETKSFGCELRRR